MKIKIELNFLPISKTNMVKIYGGKYVFDSKVKRELDRLRWELQIQKKNFQPISSKVSLTVLFVLPNKRKRDMDNMLKTLQDELIRARIIKDDSLIYRVVMEKCIQKGIKKTVIILEDYHSNWKEFLI